MGLISLAASGVHALFRAPEIRRAFDRIDQDGFNQVGFLSAHTALQHLSGCKALRQKRAFLDSLPAEVVDILVFLYFRCVDQFLDQQEVTLH